MNADRIQLNVVPVQEQVKQSRQAFKLFDNRPSAIAQAKLIDLLSSGIPLQRTATFAPVPNQVVRTLTSYTDADHSRVIFSASPGFGQNYGKLGADIYCSHGEAHSEPNLISQKYAGRRGDWNVADPAVDNANAAPGRTSFTLYTERKPCSVGTNCLGHLQAPRYKTTDRVEYTHPAGTTSLKIAEQYLAVAQNALPPAPENITFDTPIAQNVFDARYRTSTPKIVIPYTTASK